MPLLGSAYVVCCSVSLRYLTTHDYLLISPAHISLLTYPAAAAAAAAHPHHIYHITSHSIAHRTQHIITTPDTSHLTHASYLTRTYTSPFVRHYREFLAVSALSNNALLSAHQPSHHTSSHSLTTSNAHIISNTYIHLLSSDTIGSF